MVWACVTRGLGITGKGVKVAVLDDPIVSDYPALAGADVSYKLMTESNQPCHRKSDPSQTTSADDPTLDSSSGFVITHGTSVVSLIVGNGNGWDGGAGIQGIAPDASVTAYMVFYQREGRLGGERIYVWMMPVRVLTWTSRASVTR